MRPAAGTRPTTADLRAAYGEAHGHGRGADRLEEIAAALAESRVDTLRVEAHRRIPGRRDGARGGSAQSADVLDDLAGATLRTGGEVIVLEAARMPAKTGAAAVFRY